ncbi:hypothetical protein CDAR_106511 [Caerostris darwini]|uniref:Uncharacterized protein n=1 Tax=Caerostris darwini TaxID=1538125 RepID=A0AAV4SAJ9_9ARAC|nr:hypothetical protein CDAR_106511 [Caerostris darwini]
MGMILNGNRFNIGIVNGNERIAIRLYQELFATRKIANYKMLAHVQQNSCEQGSFRVLRQDTGCMGSTRITDLEKDLLNTVDRNPAINCVVCSTQRKRTSLSSSKYQNTVE